MISLNPQIPETFVFHFPERILVVLIPFGSMVKFKFLVQWPPPHPVVCSLVPFLSYMIIIIIIIIISSSTSSISSSSNRSLMLVVVVR